MNCKTSISWVALALVLAAGGSCVGCGGGGSSAAAPPVVQTISVNVSPNGNQTVDQGQSKNFAANVSNDSSNKGVTWTLTQNSSSCSPGCGTLSATSSLSGAPVTYTAPAVVNANLQFDVTATSVADTTKSVSDQTTAVPPPALNNPANLPTATVGQPYSHQLTEVGGVPPFTWSIISGSLPAGLTLSSSGLISGTPTTASQAIPAGLKAATVQPNVTPSGFTAQGCDSGTPPLCNAQTLKLLVGSKTPAAQLQITTNSLTNANMGQAYSAQLQATGGTPPYIWSATGLPSSFAISSAGAISSNSPFQLGAFNVNVTVSDSAATPAMQSIKLTLIIGCVLATSGAGPANANASMNGTWSFLFAGVDALGQAVARAGSFVYANRVDPNTGLGLIEGGVEDVRAGTTNFNPALPLSTTNSSICIDFSGRGTMVLSANISTPPLPPVYYSVTYRVHVGGTAPGSNQQTSLIEFDPVDNVRGSGELRLQLNTTTLTPVPYSGNKSPTAWWYVFGLSGRDANNASAAVAGVFNLDASLASTNCGTTIGNPPTPACEDDFNDAGTVTNYPGISVTLTPDTSPNPFMRYTGKLTAPSNSTGDIDFAAYVVPETAANGVLFQTAAELFVVSNNPGGAILSGKVFLQNPENLANLTPQMMKNSALTRGALLYMIGGDPSQPLNPTNSAATIGAVDFDGAGHVPQVSLDVDVAGVPCPTISGAAGPCPIQATTGTYAVSPDGKTTSALASGLAPIAYIYDADTAVVLDTSPSAGLGRLLFAEIVSQLSGGFLIADIPPAVRNSTVTIGSGSGLVSGSPPQLTQFNLTQDVNSPSGLSVGLTTTGLPIAGPGALGRFTVGAGTCAGTTANGMPCLAGYEFGADREILIEMDLPNGNPNPAPVIIIWNGSGLP